jgi:hypothetical protein
MSENFECKKYYFASYFKHGKRDAVIPNFTISCSNIYPFQVIISYELTSQNT